MALLHVVSLLALAPVGARARSSLRSTKDHVIHSDIETYSFTSFVQDFDRRYALGTKEYHERARLFKDSLDRISAINAKNKREGRSWVAGTHSFMDWTPQELRRLQGYKPARARTAMIGLQLQARGRSSAKLNASADYQDEYIGQGTEHRNQGNCGSCWAISAAEAVEAQLKRSGQNERVSAQALVDCVPNPQHCGGTGGCDGATGELAFAFMQQHGIPLESEVPYRRSSMFGGSQEAALCKMESHAEDYPSKRRVTVDGWDSKPSNHAEGLMQALLQEGSAVVAVDAREWFDYHSGVYDGCTKDAELGHAVLAKGYGKDTYSGKKFWLIQNSWGTGWGESGDIRLLRHDRDDEWCGTDYAPQKGEGCDNGPSTVPVCGMCGVLYDPVVPTDVRIVDDADLGSMARVRQGDYTPWRPPK
jgi:cathepsin L